MDAHSQHALDIWNLQIQSFENHVVAASKLNCPVIIHSRDCDAKMIDIIKQLHKNTPFKGIFHCFTGSYELAKAGLDLDLFISFSGVATFSNAQNVQEVAKKIPINKILIETDSPYLAPVPHRGKKMNQVM